MLTPTHLIAGQTFFLAACLIANHSPTGEESVVAIIGSLLPDIDSRQSIIGRTLGPISQLIEHQAGHRTVTHSLLMQIIIGALVWLMLPEGFALALMAGWISHSFADMMTPSGVAWFWPSRIRCVLPGNERYRMKAMGWGELAFVGVMGCTGVVFMMLAQAGEGTGGLIRMAIGDIAAARQQYDAQKGRNAWTLRIEGRDNRSFESIDGEYPIRGPWRENGFILDDESGPVSVCMAQGCDWYPVHAVLVKGQPEITTTTTIRREQMRAGSLFESLAAVESEGKVYLLGIAKARGIKPQSPSVEISGETVKLAYADLDVLRVWPSTVLREVELTVQVRHEPGKIVREIQVPGEQMSRIDPLLLRWLIE